MSLIKCPECGKEVSDKAKSCIHCGCPLHKSRRQILTKSLKIYLCSAISLCLVSIVFFVLFLLTLTDMRTIYFDDNNFRSAEMKIGGMSRQDKELQVGEFNVSYCKMTMYDDSLHLYVDLSEPSLKSEQHIRYYLANAKMEIEYRYLSDWSCYFEIKGNVLVPTSKSLATLNDTQIDLAATGLNIANEIVDAELEGYVSIVDVLDEYYNYCLKVNSIRIMGITLFSIMLAGSAVFFIFFIIKKKTKSE